MNRIFFCACVVLAVSGVASADKNLTKNGTWDCKKDPTVQIGNGEGKYVLKGKCKTVDIGGGENSVTIESVETLSVGGAENKIVVGTVGAIDVGGTENKIVWKKALKGDAPTLSGQPEQNTIVQDGSGAKATSAAGTTSVSDGTAIDCGKSPAFSQNENDGSFTLTGKCSRISIAGNNNKLKVENVKALALSGNGNTVEVTGAVEIVALPGNSNTVTYSKALKGVRVSKTGNGNKVTTK